MLWYNDEISDWTDPPVEEDSGDNTSENEDQSTAGEENPNDENESDAIITTIITTTTMKDLTLKNQVMKIMVVVTTNQIVTRIAKIKLILFFFYTIVIIF